MGGRQGRAQELQDRREAIPGTHHNGPGSVDRFQAAFQRELPDARIPSDRICWELCNEYWKDRDYNASPRLAEAKPLARKVAKALQKLIDLVGPGDAFANDAIYLLSLDANLTTAERIDLLYIWRDGCHELIQRRTPAGRPRRDHIEAALARLGRIWTTATGKKFARNIRTVRHDRVPVDSGTLLPTGARESVKRFEASGPQFALLMLQAIDSSVKLEHVSTALQSDGWWDDTEMGPV